jgi:hypothetical protein
VLARCKDLLVLRPGPCGSFNILDTALCDSTKTRVWGGCSPPPPLEQEARSKILAPAPQRLGSVSSLPFTPTIHAETRTYSRHTDAAPSLAPTSKIFDPRSRCESCLYVGLAVRLGWLRVCVRTGVACVWFRAVCASVCVWNVLSECA